MTQVLIIPQLSAEQQGKVFGVLSVGCDRETAANFIGCTVADIARAMRNDPAFGDSVRRTEASAELNHMRAVQEAAKDVKNWRASVWWLERRSPERFGSRSAGTVTPRQLKAFLAIVGDCINDEIHNLADRERLLTRFNGFLEVIDELGDDLAPPTPPSEADDADPFAGDESLDFGT